MVVRCCARFFLFKATTIRQAQHQHSQDTQDDAYATRASEKTAERAETSQVGFTIILSWRKTK